MTQTIEELFKEQKESLLKQLAIQKNKINEAINKVNEAKDLNELMLFLIDETKEFKLGVKND